MEGPKMRPETGLMQFGEDWPGLFVRGDDSFHYADLLSSLLVEHDETLGPIRRLALQSLVAMFRSTNFNDESHEPKVVQKLKEYKECT